jgi:hypothetical protein
MICCLLKRKGECKNRRLTHADIWVKLLEEPRKETKIKLTK